MPLRIVRLGSPRAPGEGTRIGTVRRPPRGVPKAEFASRDYYDVWLPLLSPEAELVQEALHAQHTQSDKEWQHFVKRFRKQLAAPDASTYCAMAKRFATDAGFTVINEALQLHGGYGYIREYPLERLLRDARVHQILEGTNEIMRVIIGRRMLDGDAPDAIR